jgi:hypothetical protein
MSPNFDTLNGQQWLEILEHLSEALGREGSPVSLCLMGSAACLFGGMEGRTSRDLDIWKPMSDYDRLELRKAAESVGLAFNPTDLLEPSRPYLQIVESGIAELGEFKPIMVEKMGRLLIARPPIENLIAAKLIRADQRDVADVLFLQQKYRPDLARVRDIVNSFSFINRQKATENFIYLEVNQTL